MSRLHLFRDAGDDFEYATIASDRIVRGEPVALGLNVFESGDQKIFSGIWRASVGAWRVSYTETEYCYILQGRARLKEDDGAEIEVGVGDGFVIEGGFEGVWEVLEPLEKHYMIVFP